MSLSKVCGVVTPIAPGQLAFVTIKGSGVKGGTGSRSAEGDRVRIPAKRTLDATGRSHPSRRDAGSFYPLHPCRPARAKAFYSDGIPMRDEP